MIPVIVNLAIMAVLLFFAIRTRSRWRWAALILVVVNLAIAIYKVSYGYY